MGAFSQSGALCSAECLERSNNLSHPLAHFILAQSAVVRLQLSPQQDGIFAGWNRPAVENFNRLEAAQFCDAKRLHRALNPRECHAVGKHKREIALHARIFRQGLVLDDAEGAFG